MGGHLRADVDPRSHDPDGHRDRDHQGTQHEPPGAAIAGGQRRGPARRRVRRARRRGREAGGAGARWSRWRRRRPDRLRSSSPERSDAPPSDVPARPLGGVPVAPTGTPTTRTAQGHGRRRHHQRACRAALARSGAVAGCVDLGAHQRAVARVLRIGAVDARRCQRERRRSGELLGGGDEPGAERGGVGALAGIEATRLGEDGGEWTHHLGHDQRVLEAGHQRGDGGVGAERHGPRHGLDEHERQRVDVAGPVDRLAAGLLRRGVAGGAQHGAGRFGPACLGDGAGQAEVGDPQPGVVAEQEVGRLDVAVHEALPVGVVEGPYRLQPQDQRLRRGQSVPGVEHRAQAAAAQELGDEIGRVLVAAPVEHRQDVRVAQRGGGAGLRSKAAQEQPVVGEGRMQHLDRDPAPQANVVCQVDMRRRPGSDRREKSVAPTQHTTDLLGHAGHGHVERLLRVGLGC